MQGVSKRFGGVDALHAVTLAAGRGSIHGLLGENGAGKSTLGRIISGLIAPDSGRVVLNGQAVAYRSPAQALRDGVAVVSQELSLVPQRTVVENVLMGRAVNRWGLVSRKRALHAYEALAELTGFDVNPRRVVGTLRRAEQQQVQVLRAVATQPRLLVMDEPTSSQERQDAQAIFEVCRRLSGAGVTVIYVSHYLEEVLSIADTVTVLRDGRLVRTGPAHTETLNSLIAAMTGTEITRMFPEKTPPPVDGPAVLVVKGIERPGRFSGISLSVRRGEILGLAGLVGSGRSEILRAICGVDRFNRGEVIVNGVAVHLRAPHDAWRAGIAMLPESRQEEGLFMQRSLIENMMLPHLNSVQRIGLVCRTRELRLVQRASESMDIRAVSLEARVGSLSGGNQQKTLFARALLGDPVVVCADEPTRGIDVGAKHSIYERLRSLALSGLAVILVTSEPEELVGLAHRALVLRAGHIVGELRGAELTGENLLRLELGASSQSVDH